MKTLTSHGSVSLTAAGGIGASAGAGTPQIIADTLSLQAGTGITGLTVAANTLTKADTSRGNIQIADVDGVAEQATGMTVTTANAHDAGGTNAVSLAIQADGPLTVVRRRRSARTRPSGSRRSTTTSSS